VKISSYLKPELIEPNLPATEKDAVLEQLVRLAMPGLKEECAVEGQLVLDALREREAVASTGIGNGIAIPHAKIEGLKKMMLAFARSKAGVNFQAMDDAPVNLLFLLIAPPTAISSYLKLLAAISTLLKSEKNRIALLKASTPAEVLAIIKAGES
jgi:PTS system nitrogen regulatory IIA component